MDGWTDGQMDGWMEVLQPFQKYSYHTHIPTFSEAPIINPFQLY